ncbi:MAG: hypothetical protein NC084_06265 [Bacteroides sp.]|nr:hypothetical protein [Eubacterium sp.]MCM1418170.1 hypothetical protein [Roseburia sp.]MCM1462305.1 hypothetical protein [Bacteroides sp.]
MATTKTNEKWTSRERIVRFFDDRQKRLHTFFPEGSFLSNQTNAENALMLITYYRRNLHRYATEYLKIPLYLYQQILLYFMGRSRTIVIIASRCAAKSFLLGVYEMCISSLYPNSACAIVSRTLPQAEIIISKKIQEVLVGISPTLKREMNLNKCKTTTGKATVKTRNGSTIFSVALSGSARGNRSTSNVHEEARELDENKINEFIKPFTQARSRAFLMLPDYDANDPELIEEPTDISISSSISDTHWLYKRAKDAFLDFLNGGDSCMVALDYSVVLKHGLKTYKDLAGAKRTTDPTTWMVEYENAVLRSNAKAYFTYDMVREVQTERKAFYPRKVDDFVNQKKNPYAIPKQPGEVRIVSCDIAFVDRAGNDNSCYSCLRLLPENVGDGSETTQIQYRVKIPYLEAKRGSETRKQAIRIRQLHADFDADYIVLDTRNGGSTIMDYLCRPLYDDERFIEYVPIRCMNDDALNRACTSHTAQPIVFAISASYALNSKIAINFKGMMLEHRIDLLIPKDEGVEELQKYAPEYRGSDNPDVRMFYEKPYLETMLLLNELINLEGERNEMGMVRIREHSNMTKDRYTSVSYGVYFASELSRDLLREGETLSFSTARRCVSQLKF